jgi:hypothetical protein
VWEKVPPFTYKPASFARSLREIATPLALLVLWVCAAGVAAAFAARRVQP